MKQDDPKTAGDWSSAACNYATAGGISNDKAAVIDGRPTERRDIRSVPEIENRLRSMGLLIEGEAEEIEEDAAEAEAGLEAARRRPTNRGARRPFEP
jgi:hypothetical protein